MVQRTTNPRSTKYKDYGGRGIRIEDARWRKFENFYADMGNRPQGLTLERVDNDRGYCKQNCKWATRKEQMRNRRPIDSLGRRTGRIACKPDSRQSTKVG